MQLKMAKELTLQFGDFMLQVFMLLLTQFFFQSKIAARKS